MARAEATLLQLCARRNKERDHEDRLAGSFRLGLGRGRYSRVPLLRVFGAWSARLANGCSGSLTSSNHTVGFVFCIPAPHRTTGSFRRGPVHGDCCRVGLLQTLLLLGGSIRRRFKSDHMAVRCAASASAGRYPGNFVFGLPPSQTGRWTAYRFASEPSLAAVPIRPPAVPEKNGMPNQAWITSEQGISTPAKVAGYHQTGVTHRRQFPTQT